MGKLSDMKDNVDGFLRHKHIDWDGITGDVLLEGKSDGFSWAFIESHWYKDDICCNHKKHRMLFYVDISCFREVMRSHWNLIIGNCFDVTLPSLQPVALLPGSPKVSHHRPSFRSQSPSKWNNGYGICEYLVYQLEAYDSSAKRLDKMIVSPFETLFGASPEKLRAIADDIMSQLRPFFIWGFSFGMITKPGFDKFDYVVKTDTAVMFNTLRDMVFKADEDNDKMSA